MSKMNVNERNYCSDECPFCDGDTREIPRVLHGLVPTKPGHPGAVEVIPDTDLHPEVLGGAGWIPRHFPGQGWKCGCGNATYNYQGPRGG